MKEDGNRIDSWLSQLYFCLMSNFGSYVKALRKASTHLTEEPSFLLYNIVKNVTKTILFTNKTLLLQDIRELNFIKVKKNEKDKSSRRRLW